MEPITIDSSDEEDTAPNGAYDRPTTGRDPRLRPGAYYAGRPTRACPTGIRQARGPTRAPSSPMQPTMPRAPPRRATPHPTFESSDESPSASPTRRAAPPTPPRPSGHSRAPSPPMRPSMSRAPPRRATPHPMSESSDESPPPRRAAPPTPPRPSGRSISPFYTDRTGRRIPCSQAPPSGPYQGSYNPGPPNPDAPGHSRWFHNPRPAPGHPDPTAAAPPPAGHYSPCSPRQQDPESDEDDDEEGDSRSSSPAAPTRDEDYVLEDATDSDATPLYPGHHGEEAGEQSNDDAQTISSDSEPDDGAPSAAHYQWEGEERYGFWRGSWIQLIHARYTSILIEAPFRPTPDPIVTFPPSPERLCPPAVASTGEDAVLPIFPGDRADDNAPLASTSQQALRHITDKAYDNAPRASTSRQALHNISDQTYNNAPRAPTSQPALRISDQIDDDAPLASSSQGSIPTADETTEHGYQPTGKAMLWESESSDSETETGQKFRRKETQPRPQPNFAMPDQRSSAHRREIATAMNALHNAAETNRRAANHNRSTTHEEVTPPATPRVGFGDRGFDLSPGTMDILMEELEPGVEGLVQELIPDWDPSAPPAPHFPRPVPATTTADEVPPPAPHFPRPVPATTTADEVPPPAPRFPRPVPAATTADEVPPPAPRFARRAPPADDFTTDDPAPERVAIPAAWWTNTHDQRVPLAVWQEIARRSHAAQYSRQRFRVRTQEGPYQITMKTTGEVQIRFGRADRRATLTLVSRVPCTATTTRASAPVSTPRLETLRYTLPPRLHWPFPTPCITPVIPEPLPDRPVASLRAQPELTNTSLTPLAIPSTHVARILGEINQIPPGVHRSCHSAHRRKQYKQAVGASSV
nr:histone-lysine N-methyltransferase 2D-like [Drosophila kikkawai]